MRITCVALTNQGLMRSNNEDSILCDGWIRNRPMHSASVSDHPNSDSSVQVFAIADGLGGHSSGEVASQFVLSKLSSSLSGVGQLSEIALQECLNLTHKELIELSSGSNTHRGMGATLAGIAADATGTVWLFHVGDSRIYRREDRFLQLLTRDDRMESREYGVTDLDSNSKSMLLQCLGGVSQYSEIIPHVERFEINGKSETFLICSDGLSDMLTLDEIEESMDEDHLATVNRLFKKTCDAGARDNVSILMLEIAAEPAVRAQESPELSQAETGLTL